MKDEQLKQLKKQLEEQVESLEERVEHTEEFETTELSNYDNHPADNATDLYDQERGMALTQFKEEELQEAKAALAAIEDGTYGKCAVCGKDIPFERLEALPTALTCIDHADHKPDLESQPLVEKEDNGIRDYQDSFEDVEDFGSSDTPQDQPNENQKDFFKDEK